MKGWIRPSLLPQGEGKDEGDSINQSVSFSNPLTPTLGFGVLRRSTSSIHGVVSLRERGH